MHVLSSFLINSFITQELNKIVSGHFLYYLVKVCIRAPIFLFMKFPRDF
jgi:hypothetical protein